MRFSRMLNLQNPKTSTFIFGPRMTGKTFLLRELDAALYVDLLDPERELELRQTPRFFWERLMPLPKGALVIVDEVQRVPVLLDYVQKGIEELGLRFILSGSSPRKLKRGGANLLGGRALDLHLHPLTVDEIGTSFHLSSALHYGTLPHIMREILNGDKDEACQRLRSYYTTYIKEEIQAEALTRHIGAFQRFLNVAAQCNGQIIEFSNISRECAVPSSTVKEYFSILEDTLLGRFLWPWDKSERRKARPKFYFFDCGVVRAIQNRLHDPPTPIERGFLFETWFLGELTRLRDYERKPDEFSFWREGTHEIDILAMRNGKPFLAIECKSGLGELQGHTVRLFKERFPNLPLVVASLSDPSPRCLSSGVKVLPWKEAVHTYRIT